MGYRVHGDFIRDFLTNESFDIVDEDRADFEVLSVAADSCDNEILRLSVGLKTLEDELRALPQRLTGMDMEVLDRTGVFQATSFHEVVSASAAYREARKTLTRLSKSLLVKDVHDPMLAKLQNVLDLRPPPGPDWEILRKRDLGHLDA